MAALPFCFVANDVVDDVFTFGRKVVKGADAVDFV
jgi:hypothetical protein